MSDRCGTCNEPWELHMLLYGERFTICPLSILTFESSAGYRWEGAVTALLREVSGETR